MDLVKSRKEASLQSLGASGDQIYQATLEALRSLKLTNNLDVIDIGCGQGTLLKLLNEYDPTFKLSGVDLTKFQDDLPYQFIEKDLNSDFSRELGTHDLVLAIEVIEHLENPRLFLRSLAETVRPGGHILLSTPNTESFHSLLSFAFRGHHLAFGPKNYPAHITPVASYDLIKMVEETKTLSLKEIHWIENGRIPGTPFSWPKGLLKGKRFAGNYLAIIRRP
jgi:2-polyprenyl-3-methyl-5-hydroxy-6-metoxy-1,4-benzoquinol methylase